MNNFEKVEAYFNNELSNSEKNDFLNDVETNTELKSEYDFQKDVIGGIKEVRKAELKAMLDKVPIAASIGTASTYMYKILGGAAATILIGSSVWYYTNSSNELHIVPETKTEAISKVDEADKPRLDKNIEAKPIKKSQENNTSENTNSNNATSARPQVITPNLPSSEEIVENEALPEENLEIPEAINNSSINLGSKINVEVKLKKKYNFHYLYSVRGLVLYGDFEEGLFEILELNKGENIELYLYYESNYYSIKDSSGKITPLRAVSDKNIKLKLEGLR